MTDVADKQLLGKVALVTGGSGGIGSAICQHLADAGAQVVIVYANDAEKAARIVQSLPGHGHWAARGRVDDSAALSQLANEYRRAMAKQMCSSTRLASHARCRTPTWTRWTTT